MIALTHGDSTAEIVPERGAICSRLRLGTDEVLYLDAATLGDPQKNVRGGIPLLFPIAGRPPPGSPLEQHGFARNLPWEAVRAGESRLECRLRTGPREDFPWPTDSLLAFTLSAQALRIDFTAHNPGDEPMPFQLGFHPYFLVSDKAAARVDTSATRAFENRTGTTGPLGRIDFTRGELDLHLLDHGESGTALHRPPEPAVKLRWSPEFQLLVLWTLPERRFICVEPWTARGPSLAAGETRTLSFEISI
jgi:galactose mutarotase-like enzyme